ncbi:MAG: hypothetical protein DWH91_04040 [Planctomycetota bacterium]|nr:MAG: hypothetical protein DWH91_04040 [Planctomycetota bacterium]
MRSLVLAVLGLWCQAAQAVSLPRVPAGYTVERVTTPEQTLHPMMGCFDDDGRLYIAESAGTNRPAAELLKDPQDLIRVLEDTDGDGTFDKSTVFADKLAFPQGVLWHRGAVYTCSSPYLWKLDDTDQDGICDKRTILVKSFGFSGNAADIHGPFLSPDGRLWWCDGRHGHEIRRDEMGNLGGEDTAAVTPPKPEPGLPNEAGELVSKGKAARIFSCKLDGTDLHVHAGGGMDNPVEVDFLETGEALGTVNLFYGEPRGDCLVHWVEGGVYPRYDQQECIDEFPSTGDPLGPVHNYGHVAVSGLTRYRSDQFFGPANEESPQHSFFVTQFNTHKVVRTIVSREGASFKAESHEDFLVSDNPDFHPTDVVEDADGSLLVIDTGGWFRIGCPTSQVAKPDIAGAVYRIRKTGSHNVKDPRGKEIAWGTLSLEQTLATLGDARPAVAQRGMDRLRTTVFEHESGLKYLHRLDPHWNSEPEPKAMLPAVSWQRIATTLSEANIIPPEIRENTRFSSKDQRHRLSEVAAETAWRGQPLDVRVAYSRCNEERNPFQWTHSVPKKWHAAEARAWYEGATLSGKPFAPNEIPHTMKVWSEKGKDDRVLEHSLINGLIHSQASKPLEAFLKTTNPGLCRVALLVLDQMPDYKLTRDQVLPLLDTDDTVLQALVLKIIAKHPGWAPEAVSLLDKWLAEETFSTERAAVLRGFLLARVSEPEVAALIASRLQALPPKYAGVPLLLDVIARSPRAAFAATWTPSLARVVSKGTTSTQLLALAIIADRHIEGMDETIASMAADLQQPHSIRLAAYSALWPRRTAVEPAEFTYLTDRLDVADQPTDLLAVSRTLADAPLNEDQLKALIPRLPQVGPLGVPVLLRVFERSQSAAIGSALVEKLTTAKNEVRIPVEELARLLRKYPAEVQSAAQPLLAASGVDLAAQAARLDQLTPLTTGGDAAQGRAVFFGTKAACATCHRIGKEGGSVGPDLSTLGAIREPRDLLESILFPSNSFARGYRSYTVVTTEGQTHTGVMPRESTDAIVLRTATLAELTIPRLEIEELAESNASIMPQGLETRLSETELRDLLAYLKSLR